MRIRKTFLAFGLIGLAYLTLTNCQGEQAIKKAQYHTNGYQLYVQHCQNCHGTKGEGLGTLYPPLTDSDYLMENRKELPAIVQYGTSEMPPNPQLSTIEIAYILTYITNAFGNDLGIYDLQEVQTHLGRN